MVKRLLLLQCYSKFGDVIFTLARFFKERTASCVIKSDTTVTSKADPLPPRLNETEKKVIHLEDDFAQKALSHPRDVAMVCLKRKCSSDLARCQGSHSNLLENVIPANRCSLSSSEQNQHKILKHSRDLFFYDNKVQRSAAEKGSSQPMNHGVIDLSSDTSPDNDSSADCLLVSSASKKLKAIKCVQRVMNDCGAKSFHEHFDNLQSTRPVEPSVSALAPRNHGPKESLRSCCGTSDAGTEHNMTSVMDSIVGLKDRAVKTDLSCSASCNEKEMRGLAFLIQIKEKLSASEYQEFVHLMKALKSKTMKIAPVLRSIAKLLSSPGRFHLLRNFKDYVPAKFQPTYEHIVASLYAAFGDDECYPD